MSLAGSLRHCDFIRIRSDRRGGHVQRLRSISENLDPWGELGEECQAEMAGGAAGRVRNGFDSRGRVVRRILAGCVRERF
jgi:hypothetical protein